MSGPGEAWSHRNAPGWLAGKVRWTFQPVAPALAWIAVIGLSAFLHVPSAAAQAPAGPAAADTRIVFPASVQQGAMVIGKVPPGSQVEYAGRTLRSTGYGTVVFGVGRDQAGPVQVTVRRPDGSRDDATIAVSARDWPLEYINGVPPKTVRPMEQEISVSNLSDLMLRQMLSPLRLATSAEGMFFMSTTNSSPPILAAMSSARRFLRRAWVKSTSMRSPRSVGRLTLAISCHCAGGSSARPTVLNSTARKAGVQT